MAREMTSQERAEEQYTMNDLFRMAMDGKVNIVEDKFVYASALQQTRRAALLEAAEIAKECAKERRKEEEKYGEHVKNDPRSIWASCRASEAEVIVAKIDRLAQEG